MSQLVREAEILYNELVSFYYDRAVTQSLLSSQCYKEISINGISQNLNLLNLTCNEKLSKELWQVIHHIEDHFFRKSNKKDDRKNFKEFISLNYLLNHYPEFRFSKSEQPDFLLWSNDNEKIGLEVTLAVSGITAQSNSIAERNFGRNKKPDEISEYIASNHKKSADKIDFSSIGDSSIIGTSGSTNSLSKLILTSIKKKIKKAHKYLNTDLRWLLIDVDGNPSFSNYRDARIINDHIQSEFNEINVYDLIIVQNIQNKATMFVDCKTRTFSFVSNDLS